MTYTTHKSTVRSIKSDNPNFYIHDKFTSTPRAGFEISQRCPENYISLIQECISHGWLKPVAHVTERELIFMGLTK
jgi:hypothetical protein